MARQGITFEQVAAVADRTDGNTLRGCTPNPPLPARYPFGPRSQRGPYLSSL